MNIQVFSASWKKTERPDTVFLFCFFNKPNIQVCRYVTNKALAPSSGDLTDPDRKAIRGHTTEQIPINFECVVQGLQWLAHVVLDVRSHQEFSDDVQLSIFFTHSLFFLKTCLHTSSSQYRSWKK